MKKIKISGKNCLKGAFIGFVNGFFGAGGGLAAVPLLMKMGFERKLAHANAVAVILPITFVSLVNYLFDHYKDHMKCYKDHRDKKGESE